MNDSARTILKYMDQEYPYFEDRINRGIEENRKGSCTLHLKTADGAPVSKASIRFCHKRHEYHFGCNGFMLGQFEEDEKNAAYEEEFAKLFNLAVVPFYWSDLEPEDGKPRFDRNSPPIYRRPPIDSVLDYCEAKRIIPKGHPLVWHEFIPDWIPTTKSEIEQRWEKRIREIAKRYGERIGIWDVCNEALQWNHVSMALMPDEHVEKAFRMAEKYFPTNTRLLYNEGPWASWNSFGSDYTPLYLLARHLKQAGLPIRGLGLQYHLFYKDLVVLAERSRQMINPVYLFAHMDQYAKLGLPLNVSEITIPAHQDFGDGERFQAYLTERLYRIWFSHAATNGIVWWNMVDGTAAQAGGFNNDQGENRWRGGVLNFDMSHKPAFTVLDRLINEEWSTDGSLTYEDGRRNGFRGFYGEYELAIDTDSGEVVRTVTLSKESRNEFTITLETPR